MGSWDRRWGVTDRGENKGSEKKGGVEVKKKKGVELRKVQV